MQAEPNNDFADLIEGGPAIADYIGKNYRQTVYLLSTKRLPGYKIGATWFARRSKLLRGCLVKRARPMPDTIVFVLTLPDGQRLYLVLPDPVSTHEYCGSRARPTTGSDRQDEPIGSVNARLRPWPKDWEGRFKHEQSLDCKIYDLRKALTLKETADKLGMSTTTVWRRQHAYMETLHG